MMPAGRGLCSHTVIASAASTSLPIIQVGLGGWGRDWALALRAIPDVVETVGWVEPWPDALALAQKQLGLRSGQCFGTLAEAVAAVDAAAVLVTTALPAHLPVVHEALSLGLHVLCEKPFGPSADEARTAVDAADAAGLILAVSQNYRFYPATAEVARIARSGELGALSRIAVDFRKWANDYPREGHAHYAIRHPLLLDMSIHHFDLLRWVTGLEPVSARAVAWNPSFSNFGDPSTAAATLHLEGGVVVDYRGSWTSTDTQTAWSGDWTMEFEHGAVHWHARDDRGAESDSVVIIPRGGKAKALKLAPLAHLDRLGATAEFARAVRAGDTPSISARENLGTLALTFGVIDAAESGEVVNF
jgi:predicted dehydrogenase